MRAPLILDTQLIVLLVVGDTAASIIGKHKNLTAYTEDDHALLATLLGSDPRLILLPNIVSETSNLLRQHRNPERRAILGTFAALIRRHRERYIASADLVERDEYGRLGITDVAILEACAASRGAILTADLDLYLAALGRRLKATNFHHVREDYGLL